MDLDIQKKTHWKQRFRNGTEEDNVEICFSESGDSEKDHSSDDGSVDIRKDPSAEDNVKYKM